MSYRQIVLGAPILLQVVAGEASAREPVPAGTCMPYASLQADHLVGAGPQQLIATNAANKLELFRTADGHLMAVLTDTADNACVAFDGWQKAIPTS